MRFVVKDARHAFGRHRSQSGDINACRALSSLSHASARDEIVLRCQLCGAALALEGGGPASQLPAKARFWTGAGDDTRGGARNRARPTPPKTSPVKSRTSSRPARPTIIRVAVAAKSADQPVSGRRGVGKIGRASCRERGGQEGWITG